MAGIFVRTCSICGCSKPARSSKSPPACARSAATSPASKPASPNYATNPHENQTERWSVGVLENAPISAAVATSPRRRSGEAVAGSTPPLHLSTSPRLHYSLTPLCPMTETATSSSASAPAVPPPPARGKRKERVGEVISNKMAKTIVVRVERRFPHPKFKKVYAHDETSQAKVGDRVRIEETRPLSKLKRWRLVEVVAKSSGITPVAVRSRITYHVSRFMLQVRDRKSVV